MNDVRGSDVSEHSDKVSVFGYEVVRGGLEGLCRLAREAVEGDGGQAYLVALNAEKVAIAKKREDLDRAIRKGIAYTDGMPVAWAARLVYGVDLERVTGTDIMFRLCKIAAEHGWNVYLLGAHPSVNQRVREVLERAYPELRVVGTRDGYFDPEESSVVVEDIKRSGADVLFVALGSPKQELWIADNLQASGVRFAMGVGGSFDVFAGEKPRAPEALQRAGLEWAYRVAHEPWRLRRIVPRFTSFLMSFVREAGKRIGRRSDGEGGVRGCHGPDGGSS